MENDVLEVESIDTEMIDNEPIEAPQKTLPNGIYPTYRSIWLLIESHCVNGFAFYEKGAAN